MMNWLFHLWLRFLSMDLEDIPSFYVRAVEIEPFTKNQFVVYVTIIHARSPRSGDTYYDEHFPVQYHGQVLLDWFAAQELLRIIYQRRQNAHACHS